MKMDTGMQIGVNDKQCGTFILTISSHWLVWWNEIMTVRDQKHLFHSRLRIFSNHGDRITIQRRRQGFLSGGMNHRHCGQLTPKYPKNRKRHRIWAASFSNLEETSPPNFFTVGDAARPSVPPPPLSTPICRHHSN